MTKTGKLFPAIALAALLWIAACASPTSSEHAFRPAAAPKSGMSLVYIYRTDDAAAPNLVPVVRVDGKTVGPLRRGDYTAIYLHPGWHIVSLEPVGVPATPLAPDHEFNVVSNGALTLGLEFVRTRLDRPEMEVDTKQGKMTVPSRAGQANRYQPFFWREIDKVEASPQYADLRQREYRAPQFFGH
ncbi:hypothetical protein [Usitatibacter palustris]|uniref:DUF2846 domain-containing protein n=1 Tax=Usitatibacter palustris TaxID=2732487 RepID=A0A6M4H5M4_9PROT|nr:hypothetical protein [Usitatibacter palustris]QJR14790.1 hypothetical protein DSM104440_01600 [Usitatibacter palustris]